jgi:hypothetical protein
VFESLTTSFWKMYTPLISRPLGIFGALTSYHYHISVILAITKILTFKWHKMAANYDAHSPPPVYIWGRLLKQCSSTLCSILVNLLLLITNIFL